MPWTPMAVSASRTSSSLKGLMMAITSFMGAPSCQASAGIGLEGQRTAAPGRCGVITSLPRYRQSDRDLSTDIALGAGNCRTARHAAMRRSGLDGLGPPYAQHALLGHRGGERAVGGVDQAAGEAAGAMQVRAV